MSASSACRSISVDLLHVHALMGPDDLAAVSAKGGAYEAAVKAKEQKMARFIGITCHAYPDVLKTALERHEFDCTQMALNAAMRTPGEGFAGAASRPLALPVALRKKMGVTAMKIFAAGRPGGTGAARETDPLLDVAAGGRHRHRHAQGGAHRAERRRRQGLQAAARGRDEAHVRRAFARRTRSRSTLTSAITSTRSRPSFLPATCDRRNSQALPLRILAHEDRANHQNQRAPPQARRAAPPAPPACSGGTNSSHIP